MKEIYFSSSVKAVGDALLYFNDISNFTLENKEKDTARDLVSSMDMLIQKFIEKELEKSMKNKELVQLLELEKSLVYFSTSLRSNEAVLEKLMRLEAIKKYPEDKELLEDVIVENRQAIEMANIYSNILNGVMGAFGSVISNNLNIKMKFLTGITIVLSIPTMISSFFGMNVQVPFSHISGAFLIIGIISLGAASAVALYMAKRKMF